MIYIPIWLDLLYIYIPNIFRTINAIYIPIWLDLLSILMKKTGWEICNLHSNMVRFIITRKQLEEFKKLLFTFQYG